MSLKNAFIILSLFTLLIPSVCAEEQYHHILTLESPNPENSAWFGYQVKISDNIIVLSEPYANTEDFSDAGKVYVYDTDGTLISTLQSPTPGYGDNFGFRFDLLEDTIIVGETSDIGDLLWAGRVHVFTTDGTLQYTLQSQEPRKGGVFGGSSIAFDEEVLVISETNAATKPGMAGKVHLYDSEGVYLKSLLSPSPKVRGRFGSTIEVGEGLILVGEYGEIVQDKPLGLGSVYVFDYNGTHLMTLQAPEPEDQACFGSCISISGDRIVIGESYATVNEVWRAGRAYIFNTDGELLQTLQSPNPKMTGRFGDSVTIDGDRLVVGEWDADVNPGLYEGRAYVYDINGNLLQNLTAPSPCPRAAFGLDVEIDGDTIVIGESWAAIEDFGQAGRVHVYGLGPPLVAAFEVSSLLIDPDQVDVGADVSVSVMVANTGSKAGTYTVVLMVGGEVVDEKDVTLSPGETSTVSFMVEADEEGTFSVDVNGLSGSITVKRPPIPGFPVVAVLLGLVCISMVFYALQRKQ